MQDMYKLDANGTRSLAKELTIKAIENGMIPPSPDSATTAKKIVTFYQTLIDNLNQ